MRAYRGTASRRCKTSSSSTKARSACLGSNNYISKKYTDLKNDKQLRFDATTGWLGITDKYWATAVIAEPEAEINALFSWRDTQGFDEFQTSFVDTAPVTVAPGASGASTSYVFAGAKVEQVISGYDAKYGFDRLDLLIDWGWFHFITYPLFLLLRWLYGIIGNFGVAIMVVTHSGQGRFSSRWPIAPMPRWRACGSSSRN